MAYLMYIDDNYRYMDAEARSKPVPFETAAEALTAARRVVDDFLRSAYQPGMTADALLAAYKGFGEDPVIVCTEGPAPEFSAWSYAAERCEAICVAGARDDTTG